MKRILAFSICAVFLFMSPCGAFSSGGYEYLEQGYSAIASGDKGRAIELFRKAIDVGEDRDDIHLQIAYLAAELKKYDIAIEHFKTVADRTQSPDARRSLAQIYADLGYADFAAKRYEKAVERFDAAVEYGRDDKASFGTLGYANMFLSRNEKAIERFKQAIDVGPDWNYRSEVRKLARHFDTTLVWGWHSGGRADIIKNAQILNPIIDNTASGFEMAWTPPAIGRRDERLFQVILRGLWGNDADEFNLNLDTTQGAFGVRYKPFRTQNINFGFERLFSMGNKAENIWLARIMGSWGAPGIIPNRSDWLYWSLYLEFDRFFNSSPFETLNLTSRSVFYGETRVGWTWNFKNRTLVSPHIFGSYRWWNSDYKYSLDAFGVGVMVKFLFDETKYETARKEFELLMQHKIGRYKQLSGPDVETDAVNAFLISLYYRF